MKVQIKYLKFQRNGVAGECFYHCLALIKDDKKREMVITFKDRGQDDKQIEWSSCRAVCVQEIEMAWRGDEIAYELQKELNRLMIKKECDSIYDLCNDVIPISKITQS